MAGFEAPFDTRLAVHEYSNGRPNAQETNMIRTFAQIVASGQRQPRWGEQALATQQVLDALLCSARQDGSFVEIIDAPNQSALDVTPRAKILDMQITNGENMGSLGQVGTNLRPNLHPAIEGCPKKRKNGFRHALMFQAKIGLHQLGVAAEPLFKAMRCLDNIHLRSVGNDRTG